MLGEDQKLTWVSIEYHPSIEHWTPRVQDLLIPKLIPRPLGIYCVKSIMIFGPFPILLIVDT